MSENHQQSGGQGRPIAVLGASGQVGSAVVSALLARGVPVRRVLRSAATPTTDNDVLVTDWSETSLTQAFDGCEGAFLMVPLIEEADALGLASHIAADNAGLGRVVRLLVLRQLAKDGLALGRLHRALDDDLHARNLDTASLCPDSFMQNLLPLASTIAAGRLPNATGAGRMAFVDVADIAACATALLCGDTPCSGHHDLTGPQALSMPDVAALCTGLLGQPVVATEQGVDALREQYLGYGMPSFLVNMLCEVTQWTRDGNQQSPTDAIKTLTGSPARTLADWLEANRAAFTPAMKS